MKYMMKMNGFRQNKVFGKIGALLSVSILATALAVAAPPAARLTLADVNAKVNALLNPFLNPTTDYRFEFTKLKLDAVRAIDFGAIGSFSKKGPDNEFLLTLNSVDYAYGDGSTPTGLIDFKIDLDLVKAFGQETVNIMADSFNDLIQELVRDFGKKYGSAVVVNTYVDSFIKDPNGNVQSMNIRVEMNVDMTALPAGLKKDDVEFRTVNLAASMTSKGLAARGALVLNPLYKGFRSDQKGLKEYIEKLLSNDSVIYSDLSQIIAFADQAITSVLQPLAVKSRNAKK